MPTKQSTSTMPKKNAYGPIRHVRRCSNGFHAWLAGQPNPRGTQGSRSILADGPAARSRY